MDVREEHNTTPSDIQRKIFVGGLSYYWTKDTLERHKQLKNKINIYIIEYYAIMQIFVCMRTYTCILYVCIFIYPHFFNYYYLVIFRHLEK